MCVKYYIDDDTLERAAREIEGTDMKAVREHASKRDIGIGGLAPVIKDRTAVLARWGFPGFDKKLIVNARAESVETRPTFAAGFEGGRIVLPAAGFYEWDRKKEKVDFYLAERPVIYLAGILRLFEGEERCVVITREANASMLPVHDRMPLIVGKDAVRDWLTDKDAAREILKDELPQLSARREYEQMSLF
ncbi:MAG: SOS response-associated peptidase family protein [Lachnospiraceae bacterium]|nr:SOS response-associated peptidase family protein [Lachnospiraceae bacterium]